VHQSLVPGDTFIFSDRDLSGIDGWHCYRTEEVLTVEKMLEGIVRSLYYLRRLGRRS